MNGLNSVCVKSMGVGEFLLEFESEQEMVAILADAKDFLLEKFEMVKQCVEVVAAKSHLIWMRVRKVPLVGWNQDFFHGVV